MKKVGTHCLWFRYLIEYCVFLMLDAFNDTTNEGKYFFMNTVPYL